jgi:Tfp pilus assembly protein PilF
MALVDNMKGSFPSGPSRRSRFRPPHAGGQHYPGYVPLPDRGEPEQEQEPAEEAAGPAADQQPQVTGPAAAPAAEAPAPPVTPAARPAQALHQYRPPNQETVGQPEAPAAKAPASPSTAKTDPDLALRRLRRLAREPLERVEAPVTGQQTAAAGGPAIPAEAKSAPGTAARRDPRTEPVQRQPEEEAVPAEEQIPAAEAPALPADAEPAPGTSLLESDEPAQELLEPQEEDEEEEEAPAAEEQAPAAEEEEFPRFEEPAPARPPVLDPEDRPSIAARPRRPPSQERYVYTSPHTIPWLRPLIWGTLVACGGVAGYFVGLNGQPPPGTKPKPAVETIRTVEKPPPQTADERAQLDSAYEAGREGRYSESGQIFTTLSEKHRLWTKIPLEIARMDIYQEDYIGAQKILGGLMQGDTDARADAFFLSGVLNLKAQNYPDAETSFSAATDADPTRSEYYYFWGDCLRQEGKPQEAGVRFRSALYRNQYETAEDLLQLKIWLCDIMTDQEKTNGTDAAIDASLATPYPRAAALLAQAARLMKANRFAEAAGFISRGRAAMDQVVFRVVLHDPTFLQESWRPELAPFYETATPVVGGGPSASQVSSPSPAPPAASPPAAQSPAAKKR